MFGLGVGVVPTSAQDAITDGMVGATVHLLWPICCFSAVLWIYYITVRVVGHVTREITPPHRMRLEISADGTWAALARTIASDGLFRLLLVGSAIVLGASIFATVGLLLIGLPAEAAARGDARALKASVASACAQVCATYVTGGREVRGRIVGSTADRLFIWTEARILVPVRIDDIRVITPPVARR